MYMEREIYGWLVVEEDEGVGKGDGEHRHKRKYRQDT